MNFTIFLPVAGNSINIFLLLGLGGVVGFLSGLFGVGGGFLMTPLLIMLGVPPTVAAASVRLTSAESRPPVSTGMVVPS